MIITEPEFSLYRKIQEKRTKQALSSLQKEKQKAKDSRQDKTPDFGLFSKDKANGRYLKEKIK